eukprot:TRINITY_DN60688_c0_g1_i1.p1 TRINITY_DN60688_c0_g1~~TRINITY_DN60688_c0_g1_i1.p1  ORF type:complete len:303 (+),score=60.05 TRINITY_DN60688_c0_g1_i1:75-983(+)
MGNISNIFQAEKQPPGPPVKEPLTMGDITVAELEKYGCVLSELNPGDRRTFPRKGDLVSFSFHCWLADGTEVGASARMESKVGVGRMIRGLDRALIKMSKGQRCKLLCSPNHAYGMYSVAGSPIKAGAVLIFELELWEVVRQEKRPASQLLPKQLQSQLLAEVRQPPEPSAPPRYVPDPTVGSPSARPGSQVPAPSPIPPPSSADRIARPTNRRRKLGDAEPLPPVTADFDSMVATEKGSHTGTQTASERRQRGTLRTAPYTVALTQMPAGLNPLDVPEGLQARGGGEVLMLDAAPVPAPDD